MTKKPLVIAHRGGSKRAPENTLSSMQNGIKLQADAVEFDLHITQDLVPILMHDETILRTTNSTANTPIKDLPLSILKTLDAGSWFHPRFENEPIPTFEEALQTIQKQVLIFIEIKEPNTTYTKIITDLIQQYDQVDNVKILSFHKDVIDEVKRLVPALHTVMLYSEFNQDINTVLEDPNIDSFGLGQQLAIFHSSFTKALLAHNKEVYVYAVNNSLAMKRLLHIGVSGIITDVPDKARKIIDKRYSKTPQH